MLHSLIDVLDLQNILINPNGLLLIVLNYCWMIIGFYERKIVLIIFLKMKMVLVSITQKMTH